MRDVFAIDPATGKRKLKIWSRAGHLACVQCGTTERPHEAHGMCARCHGNWRYHSHIEQEKRLRKQSRLRASDEKAKATYEKQRAWKAANRERALAAQRASYERRRHLLLKWPVGAAVEIHYAGFWCRGTITERLNKLKIRVTLRGGTVLDIGIRKPKGIRRVTETLS